MRAGGVEFALRVAGGVAVPRGAVTIVVAEVAEAVLPFSTRISLPFMEAGAAEEFVFTKRRSSGS